MAGYGSSGPGPEKLGPLRDMPGLIICEGSNDTKQRARIISEVRKALECQ